MPRWPDSGDIVIFFGDTAGRAFSNPGPPGVLSSLEPGRRYTLIDAHVAPHSFALPALPRDELEAALMKALPHLDMRLFSQDEYAAEVGEEWEWESIGIHPQCWRHEVTWLDERWVTRRGYVDET
jgi:hypothetical protein